MKKFLKECFTNLKSNFLLLVSVFCLIILNFQEEKLIVCQIISAILVFATLCRVNDVFGKTKSCNKTLKILAGIATVGILFFTGYNLYDIRFPFVYAFTKMTGKEFTRLIYIGMIVSSFCVYTLMVLLYSYLQKLFSDVLKTMSKFEKAIYILMILFLILVIFKTYTKTNAFYDDEYIYDVIFTSDIGAIIEDNAFINLYHIENDIRQPLFAVFAMPFMGIAYTASLVFPFFYPISEGIFIGIVQALLLLFANILLANLLKLESKTRAIFVVLAMACYMSILYTFVIEQYVIGYFWLITCIYAICNKKQDSFVLAGAGGTLLTSLLLAFWIPKDFSFKKFGKYILNLVKVGLVFIYLFFIFGRYDTIMPEMLEKKQKLFTEFSGDDEDKTKVDWDGKLKQYTTFVENCFITPKMEQLTRGDGKDYIYQAIHVKEVKNYSYIGISIFAIAILGFIVSRKEKISQIALAWALFSLVLLGIIGWGSGENGMILYILYFGWAFLTLIYQLLIKICEKLKFKYILNVATVILILVCVIGNYKGVMDLRGFAINNYPASYEDKSWN